MLILILTFAYQFPIYLYYHSILFFFICLFSWWHWELILGPILCWAGALPTDCTTQSPLCFCFKVPVISVFIEFGLQIYRSCGLFSSVVTLTMLWVLQYLIFRDMLFQSFIYPDNTILEFMGQPSRRLRHNKPTHKT